MAHSKGLSSDTAKASATTLLDSSTQEPTGRTQKVRPSISISITSAGEFIFMEPELSPETLSCSHLGLVGSRFFLR